ncbi:MAG: DUF2726 domain-containing protein [Verrucomicrobiales bacterium]|nr:DUF2726 domain-containing protein [Verrucomicrobiales bacterium]
MPLLTPAEAALFSTVFQIAGAACWVTAKAHLAGFLEPLDAAGAGEIRGLHIEILICRREDWVPMLGIEVEEVVHQSEEAKARCVLLNKLFTAAGIPLLRVPLNESLDASQIASQMQVAWQKRLAMLAAMPGAHPRSPGA